MGCTSSSSKAARDRNAAFCGKKSIGSDKIDGFIVVDNNQCRMERSFDEGHVIFSHDHETSFSNEPTAFSHADVPVETACSLISSNDSLVSSMFSQACSCESLEDETESAALDIIFSNSHHLITTPCQSTLFREDIPLNEQEITDGGQMQMGEEVICAPSFACDDAHAGEERRMEHNVDQFPDCSSVDSDDDLPPSSELKLADNFNYTDCGYDCDVNVKLVKSAAPKKDDGYLLESPQKSHRHFKLMEDEYRKSMQDAQRSCWGGEYHSTPKMIRPREAQGDVKSASVTVHPSNLKRSCEGRTAKTPSAIILNKSWLAGRPSFSYRQDNGTRSVTEYRSRSKALPSITQTILKGTCSVSFGPPSVAPVAHAHWKSLSSSSLVGSVWASNEHSDDDIEDSTSVSSNGSKSMDSFAEYDEFLTDSDCDIDDRLELTTSAQASTLEVLDVCVNACDSQNFDGGVVVTMLSNYTDSVNGMSTNHFFEYCFHPKRSGALLDRVDILWGQSGVGLKEYIARSGICINEKENVSNAEHRPPIEQRYKLHCRNVIGESPLVEKCQLVL